MPLTESATPQILEIGEVSRIRHAYPQTTDFFSTYVEDSKQRKQPGSELVSAMTLIPLARRLLDPKLDLVVVHASPHGLVEGLVRTLFRRSALRGHLPLFRGLGQQLLRRAVTSARGRAGSPGFTVDPELQSVSAAEVDRLLQARTASRPVAVAHA